MENSTDTLELVKAFFDSNVLNHSVDDLTNYMVIIASASLPLFYSINWVWSYAKHTFLNIGEQPKFFEKSDLIRGALLWMLIGSYPYAFGAIESLAFQIIEATEPSNYAAWKANHGAIVVEMMNQNSSGIKEIEEGVQESGDGFSLTATVRDLSGIASGFSASFLNVIFSFLGYIVSVVIGGLSYLISKIFFVIGPLAIAFSVLPPFKDKIDKWFGTWLGVTLNLLTLNLLTTMLIGITMGSIEEIGVAIANGQPGVMNGSHFSLAIFNVIIIVMYVLSFWITGYIVGTSDAGKVLSTAVGAASSMLAYGAMKGATAAQGASSSGLSSPTSSVPDVLGAIKKTD